MELSILCKVVDNFGDIGVCYRMALGIKSKNPEVKVNLIVDDLFSFHKICNDVNPEKEFQNIQSIDVYDWNNAQFCHQIFYQNDGEKLSVILECFQCGRPDWMEKILFEEGLKRTVQIIMIDYLTAEKYAEDFHCLKSLTRSAKVQKVNFMPGFTEKTGGLIIDKGWEEKCEWREEGPVLIFTYERNWKPLARAVGKYGKKALIAQGRGQESAVAAFDAEAPSAYSKLDFMNQAEWDEMMKNCSVLFIRGEESMSRACLSGIPFVWHAYPQSDEYQLVKVKALLERISGYFSKENYKIIERVWLSFNTQEEVSENEMEEACYEFLLASPQLVKGFNAFAADLHKNGDLTDNLMKFICSTLKLE